MERTPIIFDETCGITGSSDEIKSYFPMIKEYFQHSQRKEWSVFPIDMGCTLIAHHDGSTQHEPIHVFFMHSDSWGQYGEHTSHINQLAQFIPDDYICGEDCQDLANLLRVRRTQMNPQQRKQRKKRKADTSNDFKTVRCPMCRLDNIVNTTVPIRFHDTTVASRCVCCTINTVSVIFPQCGHCVLCNDCLSKI